MGKKIRRSIVPALVTMLGVLWAVDSLIGKLPNREFLAAALQMVLALFAIRYGRRGLRETWNAGALTGAPESEAAGPPTETAHYSESAVRAISIASREGGTAFGVTLNTLEFALRSDDGEGHWLRLDLRDDVGPDLGESADAASTLLIVNPTTDSLVVSATTSAVDALEIAEGIADAYGFDVIMPGHLAAGVLFQKFRDPLEACWILNEYFDTEFTDLDDVLRPGSKSLEEVSWAPPVGPPAAPDTSRTVVIPRSGRPQIGRVLYPIGAVVLLWSAFGFMADLPEIVSDTRALEAAAELVGTDNQRAREAFLEVAARRPDSVRAHTGVACVAALDGDIDGWALSMQLALYAGHRPSEVRSCLDGDILGQFEIVKTLAGSALRLDQQESGGSSVTVTSLAGVEGLPAMFRRSSCAYGEAGYTKIGGLHAIGVATTSLSQDQLESEVAEVLKCVRSWPDSEQRDLTLRFFGVSE